jgi:hypothetical protein
MDSNHSFLDILQTRTNNIFLQRPDKQEKIIEFGRKWNEKHPERHTGSIWVVVQNFGYIRLQMRSKDFPESVRLKQN